VSDSAKLSGVGSCFFDVCVANMCFMDIADMQNTMKEAFRTLKNKGRFIFSITHPMADFLQPWITIKNHGKKYFARAVCAYMSECKSKFIFSASGLALTHYHRSVGDYLRYLREAGLWLNRFVEIITKKKIYKITGLETVAREARDKYKDLADKKRKEFATREIPLFLLVEAVKL
jgi:ubiquinone/menaquinone biosynthesis C-methylase UbiE